MAQEDIIAVFKADIEQFKTQMSELRRELKSVDAPLTNLVDQFGVPFRKAADNAASSTEKFNTKTRTASGSISTLSRGLSGITGLLGVTGRLFGINTDKIEALVFAGQQFSRVGQDIAKAQKLATAATRANTTATVAQTTAERILSAVRSASVGVISLVITGVVALGTAIFSYVSNLKEEERVLKRKADIDKEQIEINNQLIESISKRNEKEVENILNAAVRKGQITEQQADEIALNDKFFKERIRIDKEIQNQRFEASKANQDAFGRLSLSDEARINENRRKLEEEAENTLQTGLTTIREKFAKQAADEKKIEDQKARDEDEKLRIRLLQESADYFTKLNEQTKKSVKDGYEELNKLHKKAGEDSIKKFQEGINEFQDVGGNVTTSIADAKDPELVNIFGRTKAQQDKFDADEEKKRQERIEKEQQMLDTIFKAQQEAFDKKQALLEEDKTEQEKAIDVQRELAQRGLANTLAFEEKRLADLRRQQQQDAEKQKRIKLLETFLNSLAEFSKSDPKTALSKALLQVALATAATAVFAEEGGVIGEIGQRSNLSRRHKSGRDVLLHAEVGEGIIPKRSMDILGKRDFELIRNLHKNRHDGTMLELPRFAGANQNTSMATAEIVSKLSSIEDTLKNQKHQDINFESYHNVVKMITQVKEKGITTKNIKTLPRLG